MVSSRHCKLNVRCRVHEITTNSIVVITVLGLEVITFRNGNNRYDDDINLEVARPSRRPFSDMFSPNVKNTTCTLYSHNIIHIVIKTAINHFLRFVSREFIVAYYIIIYNTLLRGRFIIIINNFHKFWFFPSVLPYGKTAALNLYIDLCNSRLFKRVNAFYFKTVVYKRKNQK